MSLDDWFVFSTQTGDGDCGGTDADTWLQLIGNNGVRYPERPGYWYVLNNSGNDMERGDRDDYRLVKGSMNGIHTLRLWFRRNGDNPEWDWEWAMLARWAWQPQLGTWHVAEILNYWPIFSCIRDTGTYEASTFAEVTSNQTKNPALRLLETDPKLFNAALDTISPRRPIDTSDPFEVARSRVPVAEVEVGADNHEKHKVIELRIKQLK